MALLLSETTIQVNYLDLFKLRTELFRCKNTLSSLVIVSNYEERKQVYDVVLKLTEFIRQMNQLLD